MDQERAIALLIELEKLEIEWRRTTLYDIKKCDDAAARIERMRKRVERFLPSVP